MQALARAVQAQRQRRPADFQQALPSAIAQRFKALAKGLKDELGVEQATVEHYETVSCPK